MAADQHLIDQPLVERLIKAQFPQWAHLPVTPVSQSGWDNRTFHLGNSMIVRLPSAEPYAAAVALEQQWLPILAPQLPLPIPTPLALGEPNADYPWPWSVYGWLPGSNASINAVDNLNSFAVTLANFLVQLQQIDATGGPTRQFRGGSLVMWDAQAQQAMELLRSQIDWRLASEVWRAALDAPLAGPKVWYHGDVAAGNLLVSHGQLAAVIDFGGLGVGDPACDTTIAWTFFDASARQHFRQALKLSDAVWARGRGWALWKGMIVMAKLIDTNPIEKASAARAIAQVLEDYQRDPAV